jgi:hypothetical protein
MGVAAGLELLGREDALTADQPGDDGGTARVATRAGRPAGPIDLLQGCWPADIDAREAAAVVAVVEEGRAWLERWRSGGFAALPGAT